MYPGVVWSQVMSKENPDREHVWENCYDAKYEKLIGYRCYVCKEFQTCDWTELVYKGCKV